MISRCSVLLGSVLAFGAAAAAPSPAAAAWPVTCTNCSSLFNQLMEYVKQLEQYRTQLQSYSTQLSQYRNMVQNTVSLPMQVWSDVQGDIAQIKSLSDASSLLTGNSGDILTRLNSATGYANHVAGLANMPGQILDWQRSFKTATDNFGRTLGLQQDQSRDAASLLRRLQSHSEGADGQMRALQAGNELAAAAVGQIMRVQATISATAQYQAQRDIVEADRTALRDAAMQAFLSGDRPAITGYRTW